MFLGTAKSVYILDKVENNPSRINGHPVWASGTYSAVSKDIL